MDRSRLTKSIATCLVGFAGVLVYCVAHPQSDSLVFATLGGVFASVAFEIVLLGIGWADYWLNRRKLIATFGPDVLAETFTLAYASFGMAQWAYDATKAAALKAGLIGSGGEPMPHVATDDSPSQPAAVFRVDEAVAAHDLRALTYLATHLTRNGAKPAIRRAADIVQPFDLSFVAFGLGGSQKARQLLDQLVPYGIQATNTTGGWLDLHRTSTNAILATAQSGEVIAYVIRLHPQQFPARTWFLCAGPGPQGTVAAGFFLARQFERINSLKATDGRRLGKRPCVLVLRATPGLEESALPDAPIPLE